MKERWKRSAKKEGRDVVSRGLADLDNDRKQNRLHEPFYTAQFRHTARSDSSNCKNPSLALLRAISTRTRRCVQTSSNASHA